MKLSELIKNEALIQVDCLSEDMPIRGNVIDSGDNEFDRQSEDEIIHQLENGNEWAWCTVKVTASWEGLTTTEYLGGCSYKNKEDFMCDGYYMDMIDTCLAELTQKAKIISHKVDFRKDESLTTHVKGVLSSLSPTDERKLLNRFGLLES